MRSEVEHRRAIDALRPSLGIRTRLTLWFVMAAFGAVLVGGLIVYYTGITSIQSTLGQTYCQIADRVAGQLEELFQRETNIVGNIATDILTTEVALEEELVYRNRPPSWLKARFARQAREWRAAASDRKRRTLLHTQLTRRLSVLAGLYESRIHRLAVYDAHGVLLGASRPPPRRNARGLSWFRGVRGKTAHFTFVDLAPDGSRVLMIKPIWGGIRIVGYVVAEFKRGAVAERLKNVQFGATGLAALIDAKGRPVFGPLAPAVAAQIVGQSRGRNVVAAAPVSNPKWVAIGDGGAWSIWQQLACVAPLPVVNRLRGGFGHVPWWVVVTQAPSESYAALRRSLGFLGLAGLVGILVCGLIGAVIARHIAAPIVDLQRNVRRFARGDRSHVVDVTTGDEIGELTREFNRMAERITASEIELRTFARAVEEAADAISMTDPEGRIYYINPAFERVTGYSLEDVEGKQTSILKADKTPRRVYDEMWQAVVDGQQWRGELWNQRKNGEVYPVDLIVSPVRDEDGRTVALLGAHRDITLSRAYRESLEREVEARSREIAETKGLTVMGRMASMIAPRSQKRPVDDQDGSPDSVPQTRRGRRYRARALQDGSRAGRLHGGNPPRHVELRAAGKAAKRMARHCQDHRRGAVGRRPPHRGRRRSGHARQCAGRSQGSLRPGQGRRCAAQSDRKRGRRDARRRHPRDRRRALDGRCRSLGPGDRTRHRRGYSARHSARCLRAVLHQSRARHRPRARHRQADRRPAWRRSRYHIEPGRGHRDLVLAAHRPARQRVAKGRDMARLLIIDDDQAICRTLDLHFGELGFDVETANNAEEGLAKLLSTPADVVVSDIRMPDRDGLSLLQDIRDRMPELPVIMITAFQDLESTVAAMHGGAVDYVPKPIDLDELENAVERAVRIGGGGDDDGLVLGAGDASGTIIGRSRPMQEVFKAIGMVSQSRVTALILGESGTGKELVAHAIHRASPQADQPFIAVNCAALVETLLESEMFGHEKGAFTGAVESRDGQGFVDGRAGGPCLPRRDRRDAWRACKGSPASSPPREERECVPVGGSTAERCSFDARVDRRHPTPTSMARRSKRGRISSAISIYRLNVIHDQSCRRCASAVEDMSWSSSRFFLEEASAPEARHESIRRDARPEVMPSCLLNYAWPGNVRELENVLMRAVVVAPGDSLVSAELPDAADASENGAAAWTQGAGTAANGSASLKEIERKHITRVLAETGWHKGRACEILGISRPRLERRIKEYGLSK